MKSKEFENMRVALVQYDVVWRDPQNNFSKVEGLLEDFENDVDLLILPEMFSTGFITKEKALLVWQSQTIDWMKESATKKDIGIMASLPFCEDDTWYNRLIFCDEQGKLLSYDKRHLFALGEEAQFYKSGEERLVFEWKQIKWCPMICYDLRFPVWSRNTEDYDVLLYIANWPQSRIRIWDRLLRARAIENQCYVVGVNRIGEDGQGVSYNGHSMVVDPSGEGILTVGDAECMRVIDMDMELLQRFRKRYPFLRDRDHFSLNIGSKGDKL